MIMQTHENFMRLALAEAKTALHEGEFPVGCVLVSDNRVLAKARRKNSSGENANEIDHAEVSALRQLLQSAPGTDCRGITLYSTMEPCLMCYATMLLSGVHKFVWAYEDVMGGGTNIPLKQLNELYAEIKVQLIPNILRNESLALFQEFFRRYTYWQDSPLARYTLEQNLKR